jgi:integrase
MPSARRKHARPQPRRLLDQDKLDALQALANDTSTVTTYGDSPYHRVLKRLGKFYAKYRVEILKEPEVDPEDPIPRVPTEREHHSFLRYCLETGRGYNESGRLTVRTLKTYSRILCRIIRDRHGDSAIPPEVSRRLIKTYCQKDLVKLGAETKVHEKSQAGPEVILDMIQYLWALDEHEYHHPRDRLQLAALLQIFMFTGVRPGEIIESGCYRATNRGVLYKDLELQAVRQGTRQRWVAKIRLRHRKGGDGLGENE